MEKENGTEMVKTLDIDDFKAISEQLEYLDEYVLVSQTLRTLPHEERERRGNPIIRLKFFLIVSCRQGSLQLDINGKSYELQENNILFIMPTMIMSGMKPSDDCKVRLFGFSTNFLNNVVKPGNGTERVLYTIYKNPVWHVESEEDSPIVHAYERIIMERIKNYEGRYCKEILRHLFSAMFCEMMNELQNRMHEITTEQPDKGYKRAVYVFKSFLSELSKDGGMHRSVNYYADRLCYSPKYVSSVVKQVSGRTALDWINEYAVEQIKVQLKHSEKSIKEIADYFNFSNQSFFGKYVKAHLGMSPAKYRTTEEG